MPTYEYVCQKCGHTFDHFQSMTSKPLRTCPEDACGRKKWGKGPVQKQMGAGAGLLFKGSGFYITDYRSQNYKDSAKKDSSTSSTPTKTESKSESKPSTPTKTPSKPKSVSKT
ncbi:MAG: zinc ribbon domain-containing protein [Verrucomicrobia bacterium]|nr:zinc ribbon domain-containing protein [Verrucomicrobiota bacterium]